MKRITGSLIIFAVVGCALSQPASGQHDDGYDLWLRYRPIEQEGVAEAYRQALGVVGSVGADDATLVAAVGELRRGLDGMLGRAIATSSARIVLGTPESSPEIASLGLNRLLTQLGPDGYLIRSVPGVGTVIASRTSIGVLYGAFHLLRLVQSRESVSGLDIREKPATRLRVLNHWDNLDRTVERGYAGFSLWDWHRLPDFRSSRYTDYARANASLGINGSVLTNVNANSLVLTAPYLTKAAALADVFRPYGIRVYLTARFSAPMEAGGLATADPMDAAVQAWWQAKAAEIYHHIPDFGGFLVKANSEGQPGPQDYGRNQADGANMLADAVAPFGGVVMWRAFVYSPDPERDRAGQAYEEFKPLDGQFRDNVLIQVKNGPIDFQPREPFSPLFGTMPETPLMMEFQITKEYLGLSTHLAYLGTLYQEVLQSDTHAKGAGSTVARVIDGSLDGHELTGMAGVANIGTDRNWCGSHFDCANWYAFGRLAWNPQEGAEPIAREWLRLTFSQDPKFLDAATDMMMASREAGVNYRTPLGLHHLMARSHHYGPGPWVDGGRPDWTSVYYHRADSLGIGFDRSPAGSNSVAQYHEPVRSQWGSPKTTPDRLLLWFHHVPWGHRLESGRTVWDELALKYQAGVDTVRAMQRTWDRVQDHVDPHRWAEVRTFLQIQEREARWWRDACLLYFQRFSRMPLPEGVEPPEHDLEYYQAIRHRFVPGIPDSG